MIYVTLSVGAHPVGAKPRRQLIFTGPVRYLLQYKVNYEVINSDGGYKYKKGTTTGKPTSRNTKMNKDHRGKWPI